MPKTSLVTLFASILYVCPSLVVKADNTDESRQPHDQLKRLVGNWTTEMKSFFPDPSSPSVSKGKARFESILGGNFVQQHFHGEIDGQKYQGIGTSGYDTAKQKYVGTWMDSLNTGIMTSEGTYDVKTHTLTEHGRMSTPGGEMKTRHTSKYIDANNFLFTMYLVTPEGEVKVMEIAYTRAQGDKPKKDAAKNADKSRQ